MDNFDSFEIEGLNDTTYFRNMMAYMDQQVGKIVAKLEELQLRENTLIIFTGDNGTDRHVVSYMGNREIKGDKGYTTDAGTHVPLIASWKGTAPEGKVIDDLIDYTDVLPTVLAAAKVAMPEEFVADGHSFLPQLEGKTGTPREWIFCDYDPEWGNFPARRYAQDKEYKLYASGEFYHFTADWQEEQPLDTLNMENEALTSYTTLKHVLKNFSE
jgi:arylsulfatase A-like enzyme